MDKRYVGIDDRTKKRTALILLIAAGVMLILAVISIETRLLAISLPGKVNPGGFSDSSTYYFPSLLGLFFFIAAVVLIVLGLVSVFHLKKK